MKSDYLDVIALIERLHRHFLEVIKLELDSLGIHDINNVQALIQRKCCFVSDVCRVAID